MKVVVAAINQEKALVGAFSVIVQPVEEPMDRFTALFRNLHYHLQLDPSVHHYETSITKDDKNVLSIIASFGQKPYTLHFDSPYIVPFYKYITTQK